MEEEKKPYNYIKFRMQKSDVALPREGLFSVDWYFITTQTEPLFKFSNVNV